MYIQRLELTKAEVRATKKWTIQAFRSGDRDSYKEAKYRFSKEVRNADLLYSEKLEQQFSTKHSASV